VAEALQAQVAEALQAQQQRPCRLYIRWYANGAHPQP